MLFKTGIGYIKDPAGYIVTKYDLPPGEHPLKDGYTFVEVKDRKELDSIEVYIPPLSPEEVREKKIQDEMRNMAIERLTARGEL